MSSHYIEIFQVLNQSVYQQCSDCTIFHSGSLKNGSYSAWLQEKLILRRHEVHIIALTWVPRGLCLGLLILVLTNRTP